MRTRVLHLGKSGEQIFTCSPREAVIAAYAQSLGDWNTWDYAEKYGDQVMSGKITVSCGDFVSLQDQNSKWHQL